MLKIRLARIGRKNDPTFRVVVTEHTRGPKSGKHIEVLGNYNPRMDNVAIDGDRVKHWISNGAQVSDTVHNILVGQGVIKGKKINVLPKKHPISSVDDVSQDIVSGDRIAPGGDSSQGIMPGGQEGETSEAETPAGEVPAEEKVETPAEVVEAKEEPKEAEVTTEASTEDEKETEA